MSDAPRPSTMQRAVRPSELAMLAGLALTLTLAGSACAPAPSASGGASGGASASTAASPPSSSAAQMPAPSARSGAAEHLTFEVVRSHPHDPAAFTQGLQLVNGELYEGTGLHGQSTLRRVGWRSGTVLQQVKLDPQYFGEGIAVVGDRIVQLTWQSGTGFVYDRRTFERLRTFTYTGEGWGLTYDGHRLIMSDGTETLRFRDPETLAETGRVQVRDGMFPVSRLNELEYVNGVLYANVWPTDRVARIDPSTGTVTGWLDFAGLLTPTERSRGVDVLNGLAFDPATGHLLVTGKLWPWVFEVRLTPPAR